MTTYQEGDEVRIKMGIYQDEIVEIRHVSTDNEDAQYPYLVKVADGTYLWLNENQLTDANEATK